jgi:alkylation response protein AidB-like acyl-CoA dehydrogenase
MDLDLTPEQLNLKARVAAFAGDKLNDGAGERDRSESFSREGWQACADFGLMGLPFPKEHGGSGLDIVSTVAAMEGLGYGCRDGGLIFGINAQMWSVQTPIEHFGSEDQKRRYLPGLIDGSLIGAHAISEPESGSDAFALKTAAMRRGDTYLLNGSKTFVTNAPVADVFIVFATVDASAGHLGVTGFIVDKGTPGLSVSEPVGKMGLRTAQMGELRFDDCVIPAAQLLGREGGGAAIFNESMEWERGALLASCAGAMQHQLERCLAYARKRRQFGQAIGEFGAVAGRLADMKLRLELARYLIYRVATLKQSGVDSALEASMAKLYVSEAWSQSCLDALRVHGGYGFTTALELERDFRDSIGGLFYSGTSDVQRQIIARLLLSSRG